MIDWGLKKLARITGSDRSSEFQLTNQLITLVPAVLLAILFQLDSDLHLGLYGNLLGPYSNDFFAIIQNMQLR